MSATHNNKEMRQTSNGVNVLMVSTDRTMLKAGPTQARIAAYGKCFKRLDVIVFSARDHGYVHDTHIEGHVLIHSTNSCSRWLYGFDAWRLSRSLGHIDVVTVQDPFETGIVGFCIARLSKVPLHVQVHTDFLSPEFSVLSYLNYIRVMLAGFVLHRAQRVRVVSERIRKSIGGQYHLQAPITVLPIFVDVEKFKAAGKNNLSQQFTKFRQKLLVVSRLEPEKNVELALRSFAEAAPLDACLIIVGEGSERESLEALALSLGVASRVFFEGIRDPASYYALADLVLVTSRYEGYGMTIIESLASGVPVLATDVGIAREAGATVTTEGKFAGVLADWFKSRSRAGVLKNYPYKDFNGYVRAYCEDIKACTKAG